MSPIINANNDNFVAVAIQYRVSVSLIEDEICPKIADVNQLTAWSFWISVF